MALSHDTVFLPFFRRQQRRSQNANSVLQAVFEYFDTFYVYTNLSSWGKYLSYSSGQVCAGFRRTHDAWIALFCGICKVPGWPLARYWSACLALLPLEDETTQGADEHIIFLTFVLEIFGKTLVNVVALIEDTCSLNRYISIEMGIHLMSCAIHCFELSVKDTILADHSLIVQVHQLMKNICTPLISGRFADKPHYDLRQRRKHGGVPYLKYRNDTHSCGITFSNWTMPKSMFFC